MNTKSKAEVPTEQAISSFDRIIELSNALTIAELRKVVSHCCDLIQKTEDEALSRIDQQIAELQAQRMQIRPNQPQLPTNGRIIRAVINPDNPDERYVRGRRPEWLEKILRDNLGDKYGDQAAELDLIWKLKQ